jgi:hypothetical protein
MTNHIKKCGEQAKHQLDRLICSEQGPFTLNEHHYLDYCQKFASHYRGWRQKDSNPTFLSCIRQFASKKQTHTDGPISRIMSALAEMNVSPTPMQLVSLLPADPMDPAINIMASVRAYFQGTQEDFL